MALAPAAQIGTLAQLGGEELERLWRDLFGRTLKLPPRREFVIRLLAHRLQEKAYGGLSVSTRKRLRMLAGKIEANPDSDFLDTPNIKPGIRLIREWQGKVHKVTVVEDGFVHDGARYKSLSEVARHITGTRWSGPRFFGLEQARQRVGKRGN